MQQIHDLCGDGIALCGEARRSTTNRYHCSWRVVVWQHLPGLFRHDGFSTDGAFTGLEDSSNISAAIIIVRTWWRKLRPGNSTKSAIDQCAHRVIRMQNNGIRPLAGGDWCIVGSTHSRLLWFREFEFREHKRGTSPDSISAANHCVRVAMQPSDNCT